MIRSRRKIEAIINNAQCFQRVREEFGSFDAYLWGMAGGATSSTTSTPTVGFR